MSWGVFQSRLIVSVNLFCMDVMFLCWDIFVFSWVNVNFQRVTVRIAMCNSGDHGLVCLQLIFFSAFSIIVVIWLSSLFSDSSSSLCLCPLLSDG